MKKVIVVVAVILLSLMAEARSELRDDPQAIVDAIYDGNIEGVIAFKNDSWFQEIVELGGELEYKCAVLDGKYTISRDGDIKLLSKRRYYAYTSEDGNCYSYKVIIGREIGYLHEQHFKNDFSIAGK